MPMLSHGSGIPSPSEVWLIDLGSIKRACLCLAVAVVALRQFRRVQRRNGPRGRAFRGKPLRRWTRRYSSLRDECYHTRALFVSVQNFEAASDLHCISLQRLQCIFTFNQEVTANQ